MGTLFNTGASRKQLYEEDAGSGVGTWTGAQKVQPPISLRAREAGGRQHRGGGHRDGRGGARAAVTLAALLCARCCADSFPPPAPSRPHGCPEMSTRAGLTDEDAAGPGTARLLSSRATIQTHRQQGFPTNSLGSQQKLQPTQKPRE